MAGLRKFFGGVISGALVAGLTLVVASQVSQPRVTPDRVAGADTANGGSTVAQPEVVAPPAVTDADAAPVADVAVAEGAEPAGEAVAQATVADAVGGAEPEAAPPAPEAQVVDAPPMALTEEPADASDATEVANAPDAAPVPPAAPETAAINTTPPAAPQIEVPAQTVPKVSDDAPAASSAESDGLIAQAPGPLALPSADGAPVEAELPPPPPMTQEEEASLADPARLVLPAPDAAPVIAEAPLETQPEGAEQAALETDLPESPVIAAPETAALPEPEPESAPVIVADAVPPADQSPALVADDAAPATLAPDTGIVAQAPSTLPATPRLITAGDGALTDRDEAPAEAATPELPEVVLDDGPAMERFATAFANTEGKPLFGILLIDSGEPTLDRQSVAALPFPVSIVIDPLLPDAAAHAALYRAGGKEVVMLATGIPEGATPADVEQTFQAHAAALPDAVAVIDGSDAAFQNDRPLSTQIVPILAAQGRGLLTWDRGLNAADQVARREGLPTATIFRQIDAEGEGIPVMRRYLDRAAFKAAQEGSAIVIGTLRAETVAALLEWTIEGRASTVAIAPASALLRGN